MTETTSKPTSTVTDKPSAKHQLPIHFIKSTCFRVIHANGVWYSGDNQSNLHLTFFNERNAIPKMVIVNLDETGHIVGEDESKRESKRGIVREMEVDIVLSLQVAMDLYQTLGDNLRAIQEAQKKPASEKIKAFQEEIQKS